ncbi:flagellar protein FliT [Larsenimonas rhizosphaerae]|uniref:Flagellar protein FliT n=1 Tax=Larsenimonas rhizosphaerae TaxID=2944682 RepID=A0AA42CTL2_9GAMM|nr:flagellar protein FliT [Larsenimonas rhizosphaerae]MCX2523176.1 flagellar protein FliT [Larsenimonas rhizosphaerae]
MNDVEKSYQALVRITNSVLDAADNEDMERLAALRTQHDDAIQAVKAADEAAGTDAEFPDKARVLAFLIAKNEQIAVLLNQNKDHLTRESTRQQQQGKAQKAYLSQSI